MEVVIVVLLVLVLLGVIYLILVISSILKILQSNLNILNMLGEDINLKETDEWVRLWSYLNMYGYLQQHEEYEMLNKLSPKVNKLFEKLRKL